MKLSGAKFVNNTVIRTKRNYLNEKKSVIYCHAVGISNRCQRTRTAPTL